MLTLFPEIKCYATHRLRVGGGHELYVEESGNPDGIPVLFQHGGPGSGCTEADRRFFDAERYRIILYDQRGAGRSRPLASLTENTTPHLLEDMEQLRQLLGVDRWLLFGGSWGATLSLVYAQTYPERVLGLILRGIYLCRAKDFHWFYQEGASRVFPDYWEDFIGLIPEVERGDLMAAYHRRLTSDNDLVQIQAAKAWATWDGRCSTLNPNPGLVEEISHPHTAISLARIASHYFMNEVFLEPNQIIANADRLRNIPGFIIHGRYDMECPLDNAMTLHEAWPQAELIILRDAGHSAFEPPTVDALMRATAMMSERFGSEFGLS